MCLFEFLIRARIESLGKQRILVLFGSNLNQFKFEHRANEIYQFHKKRLVYVIYVGKKNNDHQPNEIDQNPVINRRDRGKTKTLDPSLSLSESTIHNTVAQEINNHTVRRVIIYTRLCTRQQVICS